jgi:repressor LexA
MRTLSPKQEKILAFIRRFLAEKAYPPTIRDIVHGCNISSTSVADYNLGLLEKGGHIRRHREVSRGIELLDETPVRAGRGVLIPVIGQIAAGQPIPVPTSDSFSSVAAADTMEVPREILRGREDVYALKVKGLSMIDALINDGDVVLLQHTNTVENGEMAAVWLKNEKTATLKKIFIGADRVRLQPANSQMQPIFVEPDNVEVQGKVIAVIRQLA